MSPRYRRVVGGLCGAAGLALAIAGAPSGASAQATSRACHGEEGEAPGPACLVGHEDLGALPSTPIFWTLYNFPDVAAAQGAKPVGASVVEAFGKVWLFRIGPKGGSVPGGRRVAEVGPIPLEPGGGPYSAEYLKSTFAPGMTARCTSIPARKRSTRWMERVALRRPMAPRSPGGPATPWSCGAARPCC